MKTTVKMLASGMAMCFVAPAAFAISTEQAATNLQGAAQFSHLARKSYSTALQTERITGQAMYAAFSQYGVYSPEATAAVQAHSDAIDRIKAARLEDKFGRTQLDAARLALKTATPDAVPTSHAVPQAVPQATPQAIPQPIKAPVLKIQAVPQVAPQAIPQAIPQPMKAPALKVQAVPQIAPQAIPQAIPQPIKAPTLKVQAVPQAVPQAIPQAIPQPIKAPVLLVQAVPQKQPQAIPQAIPQPKNAPVLTVEPVSQKTPQPVLPAQKTPPLPYTGTSTSTTLIAKTPVLTTTAGLPKGTLINPQTPHTSSVTYIDNTTKTTTTTEPSAKAKGSAGTVTEINQVNNYYVAQSNNRQVADNSQRIENNSQRIESNNKAIDRNAREIDDTRDELKRGLNNAAAMSSLHYHSDNAWALSTGTANGDGAALAAGIQKGITRHVAVNMQASSSFDSGWMAGAGISGDF
ncbi:hypothetical protein [Enterobacter cancerogenus]|uniref:hypothetical protein n=1 Tax=Enterobacter cancerogenus TaxID=69218 RepID=UPI001299518A|nr:hypothetical protein [Enterobacter cancerogenus]QGG09253.1 hypothetical protein GH771_11085 [Enterobacter cancerogenus]